MAKRIVTTKAQPTVEPVVEDKIISKSLNKDNQIAPTKKVGSFVPVSNVELPKTPEYYKYLANVPTNYNLHNIDVEAYKPYMPGGNVYSFDESLLNDVRAENQGLGEKIWRSSANPVNLAWNVGTGIIEGFALLPELPDLFNGGDFSNEIVEGLRSTRNLPSRAINSALGIEDTNIYDTAENASKIFAPTSAKWWLETGGGLIESIVEFAALGSTIGGAVGKGASLLSKLGKVGSASGKFMNVASKIGGQVLTSGALSFVEIGMSAKSVYDDVYQYQLAKTGDANVAKEIASKSAANTAKINMLLTMPTNMTGVGRLVGNAASGASESVIKGIGKTLVNSKTGAEMVDALGNAVNKIATKKTIAGAVIPEALQEYWEEDMNMVAEYSGRRKGGLEDASKYASWLDGAVDKIFSTEGLMNGVLGAIGGIGQTAAVELSPIYKKFDSQGNLIQDDKKGFIGNRESLLARENRLKAEFAFNKVENLKNDIKTIIDTQKELELNVDENGIKDEAKQDMLLNKLANINSINSVLDGTASNLKQVYKNIANLSNTGNKAIEQLQTKATDLAEELNIAIEENRTPGEIQAIKDQIDNIKKELSKEENRTDAMRNGVSKGINEDGTIDDNYVKLANKKIADIDKFQKDYDDIRNQFKFTDLEELSQLPRMIMEKKVEAYLQEDYINKLKEKQSKPLNQFLLEYSNKLKEEGKTDDANALLKKLTTDGDIKKEEDKLNIIQKDLVTLLTPSKRKELVKEYKRQDEERKQAIKDYEKLKQDEATNDVIKKLKDEADTVYTKSIEDDKNKSKDDYSKKVTALGDKLDFYKDKLKLAETELEKLKKDDKTPEGTIQGTEKYIETVKDNIKRLNKDKSDINEEDKNERVSITKYLEANGYISDKVPTDSILSDKKQYSSADVVKLLSTGENRKELKQIRDNKETNIKGKKDKSKDEKKPEVKKEEPKQQKTYSDVELTTDFISKYPESEILVKLPETLLRSPLYKNLINWVNKIDGVAIPTIFDNVRQGKVDFAALDIDNKTFDIVKVGEYKGKPGIITVAKKGMTVVLSKDSKQHLLFDANDVSYSGLITVKDAIANGFEAADEIQNAILETTNVPHIEQDIIMQHKGENEVNVYVPSLDMTVRSDGKGNLIATGFGKEKVFNNILSDIKEGSKVVVRLLTDSEVTSSNKELQDRYKKYKNDKNNTPVVIEYTDVDGNTNRVAYLNEELYLDREISIVDALQDNELINEVELLINTINSIDVENINLVLKIFDKTFISNFNGIINKIGKNRSLKTFLDNNNKILLQKDLKHLKRLFEYSESAEFSNIISSLTTWKTKMIQDKETGKLMRNTLDYLRKNGKQAKLVSEVSKKANGSIIFINDSKDYITVGDSFGLNDEGLQNLEIAVAKDKGTLTNMETGEYIPINYNGKFTKGIYYVKVPGTNIYVPLLHNTVGDNPGALKALVKNIKRLHELSQVKDDSNKDKWIAIKDEINTIVYQGTTKDGKTYFNVNNESVQFGTNTLFFKDADGNWRDGVRTPLILRRLGEKGKEDIEIFLDDFSQVEDKLKEVRLSVDKKNFKNNKATYLKTRFKTNVGKLLAADGKDAKGNIIYKRIGNLNPVGKYSTLINLKHTPVDERFQVRSVEAQQMKDELTKLSNVNKGITTLEEVRRIVNLIDEKYDNLFKVLKDIPVKISNTKSNATMQYGNVIEVKPGDIVNGIIITEEYIKQYGVIKGKEEKPKLFFKVISIYLDNIPKADTALPMFDRTTGRRFTAQEYMQRTLLHEILHPIIVDNAKTNPTFNNRMLQFRNDFEEIYNNDKGIWDSIFGDNKIISEILKKDINGNIQFDELIAYALTDVRVAKALNTYNSKQKGKTLWNELLDIFLDFLNYFGIVPREGSLLEELQSILSDSFQYKDFSITKPTSLKEDFDENFLSIVETETKIQQLIQSGEIVFTDENNNPC